MPITPTYPGVYIDEVPSAVRTIIGVPTAVAAFVGTATRGPVDEPRHLTSWADFERGYGGLSPTSSMSYAVYQYYLNGGVEAEVVRVLHDDAVAATIDLGGGVTLEAVSAGAWGGTIRARVDHHTADPTDNTLWNLTVKDMVTGRLEQYLNISTAAGAANSLPNALANSALVKNTGAVDHQPAAQPDPATPTADPFADPAAGANATFVEATGADDGSAVDDADLRGSQANKTGLWALLKTDIFTLLCIPPLDPDTDVGSTVLAAAVRMCVDRRAVFLVDPPKAWVDLDTAVTGAGTPPVAGDVAANAAIYFPRIRAADPLMNGVVRDFPPSGTVAGVCARTDGARGVWKAPAGTDASLNGASGLSVLLSDAENGRLNPLGVNVLRVFPIIGPVVWGARTMRGADVLANQWKYLPIRRLALNIEESLYRGTKWVVFEPNDEPLWASIRLNVGAFMNSLWRQGAFQGATPKEAYFVQCDKTNNPQNDIDRGIVNILVGFAPLKPAEFVIIHIEQLAGQIAV